MEITGGGQSAESGLIPVCALRLRVLNPLSVNLGAGFFLFMDLVFMDLV